MPEPVSPPAPGDDPTTTHPAPVDAAEMWENLCRADELFEECEALARGREAAAEAAPPPPAGPEPG